MDFQSFQWFHSTINAFKSFNRFPSSFLRAMSLSSGAPLKTFKVTWAAAAVPQRPGLWLRPRKFN